ncbi:MAG: hypothetical protein ACYCX2_10810 [Christensenellales bacterium]
MKIKGITFLTSAVLLFAFTAGCSSAPNVQTTGTPDMVTSASMANEENALQKALSKEGTWIVILLKDLSTGKELVIEGDFHDKNDNANPIYRKLALYAQDANRNITARYTLTAPKLTVKSPNTRIQGGTLKGDVYVEANGFTVYDATVDGNIYFAKQEYKDSFVLQTEQGTAGTVTGSMEVKG